ncbi:MAG TPA: glutamate--tRNA ligase family protein [Lachnospiraceae bacterium]|nr:glutamate--tRNA ligase family protein [Lachnospiraceae bacterium]
MSKQLADLLFPDVTLSTEDIEKIYPERNLSEGANVTRIGPSPTGFIHLGNLYNAIIAERLAHQSGGIFYLRIEDTDSKREVPGAVETIINAMDFYGIHFDEGATIDGEKGGYGPYRQRQRKSIYHVFAKQLVELGLAYPCFCSEEALNSIRDTQMKEKIDIGYYGEWATCSNLSLEEVQSRIDQGENYVLRFRSNSNNRNEMDNKDTILVEDAIRGTLRMPKNTLDFILLKSDGIPTYHFAHVIDDHLMRSTHVIRGEEWIPSLPMHAQMFDMFGWKRPIYCHTATLMKMDGSSKRKLSKRKDPELALSYYQKEGYLPDALWKYILTILNSDFEEWADKNAKADYLDFPLSLARMSNSGALFDMDKLSDISKDIISRMTADEVYREWLHWADTWNQEYADCLRKNSELAIKALAIGRNGDNVRKDLVTWNQTCNFMGMYFAEYFKIEDTFPTNITDDERNLFLTLYLKTLDFNDSKDAWFDKVKGITTELGYAVNRKDYKRNPENYKGTIIDLTNILRMAITGRNNAPDIWDVSMALGEKCVRERLEAMIL